MLMKLLEFTVERVIPWVNMVSDFGVFRNPRDLVASESLRKLDRENSGLLFTSR